MMPLISVQSLMDMAAQAHIARGTWCLFGQKSSPFPSWDTSSSISPWGSHLLLEQPNPGALTMAWKQGEHPGASSGGPSTPKAGPTQPGFLNHTRKLFLIQRTRIWKNFDLLPLGLFLHPKSNLKRSPVTLQGWRIGRNREWEKRASMDKLWREAESPSGRHRGWGALGRSLRVLVGSITGPPLKDTCSTWEKPLKLLPWPAVL